MTRGDIADYLGMTIETVSRSLTKLAKSGVIAIPNIHEVVIVDRSWLESLAQGDSPEPVSHPAGRAHETFGRRGQSCPGHPRGAVFAEAPCL